jgi:integrase
MTVTKRTINGKVKYRARGVTFDGKHYERTFDKKGPADKFDHQQMIAKDAAKNAVLGLDKPVTTRVSVKIEFVTLMQDYIDASRIGRDGKRKLELTTLAGYQAFLDQFLVEAFKDVTVEDMTSDDVRSAMTLLRKITPSADSARRVFRFAKSVMNWAVDRELRDRSPFGRLDIELDKVAKRVGPVTPTSAEVALLTACAAAKFNSEDPAVRSRWFDYYPIFLVLSTMGLRSSECLALQWEVLNDTMTEAMVNKKLLRYQTGVTKDNRISDPKTHNAFRPVPIPAVLTKILQERRKVVTSVWIFPDRAGGPRSYEPVNEQMWHVLLKETGVRKLGMHSLRHYVTSMIAKHVGLVAAQKAMGHHSAAFTLSVYGGLLESEAETRAKVGNLFDAQVSETLANAKTSEKLTG